MPASRSRRAGTSKTSERHSRYVSTRIGNEPYRLATESRFAERWRCCHRGVRCPGRRRGRSSARAAFSRNRDANSADCPTCATIRSSISSALGEQHRLDAVEVALGQPDRDAVVRPDRLHLGPEALGQPRLERQRPRRVHARPERRQDAQPPVAEIVAEALHDDALVRRQCASGLPLVLEVREEVLGGQLVEVAARLQPLGRRGAAPGPARQVALDLAHERAQRPPELDRPPDRVAVPERQLARLAGRRRDRHPVVADLLDPPGRRAERDHLADAGLVDHLLVELADPSTDLPGLPDEEHAEQAPVRDRAAAGDRDDPRIAPALDAARDAVPDDPRLQLGELVGRVRAGQHREDALERLATERLEGRGARHHLRDLVHGPAVHHRHRHDLLREHVQRVARQGRRLDRALVHPLGDDGHLEQVAAVLGEDHAARRRARPGARLVRSAGGRGRPRSATRPGSRGRPRPCRCRARATSVATSAGSRPALSSSSMATRCSRAIEPWCERTSSSPASSLSRCARRSASRRLLQNTIVEWCWRISSRIRGWIAGQMLTRASGPAAGPPGCSSSGSGSPRRERSSTGTIDLELERLARAGVDDRDLAARGHAAQEARDRLERALGRREADPLRRACGQLLQPLQRQRQVGAALACRRSRGPRRR